jgi:type IV pilus assembly protein PilB
MLMSEEIERMTVSRASSAEVTKVAVEQGMITLRLDGMNKCLTGTTALEEVLRVVV